MATASVIDPSEEKAYHLKWLSLLVDGTTLVLKDQFDQRIPPNNLFKTLNRSGNFRKISILFNKKVINKEQQLQLYPKNGKPDSTTFDVSLLACLLRSICGLKNEYDPVWTSTPSVTDVSVEADIYRVRTLRNEISHPRSATAMTYLDFVNKWNDLEQILMRLGSSVADLKKHIDVLKNKSIDPDMETQFEQRIDVWEEMDKLSKEQIQEVKDKIDATSLELKEHENQLKDVNKRIRNVETNEDTAKHERTTLQQNVLDIEHSVKGIQDKHDDMDKRLNIEKEYRLKQDSNMSTIFQRLSAIESATYIPKVIKQDREKFKEDVAEGKTIMAMLPEQIRRRLNKWRTIPVVGHSGAGKSTFINTLRCLGFKDKGAAETGPTQTTTERLTFESATYIRKVIEQDRETFKDDVAEGETIMAKLPEKKKRGLNKWRTIPVNIAVVGHSGAGKSTFINTIRGLGFKDKGAAETGPTQTTTEPTPYTHPKNKKLVFWELPGIGTPEFNKDNYKEKINLANYDCFVILNMSAFRDTDLWFAKELQKVQSSVILFAITHIDSTIYCERRHHYNKRSASEIINQYRLTIESNLRNINILTAHIFFIDNFEPRKYDFGKLEAHLLTHLSYYKKEQMTLTLTNLTEEVLEMKIKVLAERIQRNSKLWRVVDLIPLPFITEFARSMVIEDEVDFYREQLGLTKPDMVKTALEIKMEFVEMAEQLDLKSHKLEFTTKEMLSDRGCLTTAEKYVPVVGTVIGMTASVVWESRAERYLKEALDILTKDAMKIAKYITKLYAESK